MHIGQPKRIIEVVPDPRRAPVAPESPAKPAPVPEPVTVPSEPLVPV